MEGTTADDEPYSVTGLSLEDFVRERKEEWDAFQRDLIGLGVRFHRDGYRGWAIVKSTYPWSLVNEVSGQLYGTGTSIYDIRFDVLPRSPMHLLWRSYYVKTLKDHEEIIQIITRLSAHAKRKLVLEFSGLIASLWEEKKRFYQSEDDEYRAWILSDPHFLKKIQWANQLIVAAKMQQVDLGAEPASSDDTPVVDEETTPDE